MDQGRVYKLEQSRFYIDIDICIMYQYTSIDCARYIFARIDVHNYRSLTPDLQAFVVPRYEFNLR